MGYDMKAPNRYWGTQTPPSAKHEFFNAVTVPPAVGGSTVATIRMYGPIDSWGGRWGISTTDIGEVLDNLPETIDQIILRINSPGGEAFEGMSILNMLRAHKAKVIAVVDGLAASAASIIAVGCDETVMSPGTQLMIHSPSVFSHGNAVDLRKDADVLDGIQNSLIEIYHGKAGTADWGTLLAEETWYTAAEAVEQGLADRVATVHDAGETETAGTAPAENGGVEDSAHARYPAARRAPHDAAHTLPPPILPASIEPGTTNREESLTMSKTFLAGVRDRLGVTDAAASEETVLAALDEALAEQADTPAPAVAALPEGAIMVDQAAHEALQRDAAAGRRAMEMIDAGRRDQIIDAALSEGRITAVSRESWRAQLDKDETGVAALLRTFPKNTIPVSEIGHSDDVTDAEDALYAAAWGSEKEVR